MKKLVLSLAVLFSVAMVSCGDKKAEAVDTDTMVADTEVVTEDTATADTNVAAEETPAPAADSAVAK